MYELMRSYVSIVGPKVMMVCNQPPHDMREGQLLYKGQEDYVVHTMTRYC